MHIDVEEFDRVVILAPNGRIDQAGAPTFQDTLMGFTVDCSDSGHAILVDMSGVDFISSLGLRAFMIATKAVRPAQGRILVAEMNATVAEVFAISRFDKVVECHESLDEARASLSA